MLKSLLLFLIGGVASANTLADVQVGQYHISNYVITDGVDPSLLVWTVKATAPDAAVLTFMNITGPLSVSFTVSMLPPDSAHPLGALHASLENLSVPATVTVTLPNVGLSILASSPAISGDLAVSTALPEPATYWMVGGAALLLARKWKMRPR